ncbi:MAG: phosphatidylglycerol lysyltransferase domain-containing protein [Lachnospiraceae bacterium]|nr:phosphatidylglycerol lysyltransferase domain-containing protein [Lachnospiraceae bacterium]
MKKEPSSGDVGRAAQIIRAFGDDSQHCLTLNPGNSYFFGSGVCGVIAYTLTGKNAMSQGNPACRFEDMAWLTDEYIAFCKSRGYRPVFNSVSAEMADLLAERNFSVLKYGEEAILNLESYTLAGGKKGTLRRNVAKLDRAGVYLEEYRPEERRNPVLEEEIAKLEEQWFADKKLKLTYSVGDLQFEKPYGRRYFITRDAEATLLTVLSFLPYKEGKGYCVDVMYRKLDGPTGAMEHAIISAAMKMKDDGVKEISLNIAPLAGIDVTDPDTDRLQELLHVIYNQMDFGYDFKNLYRFKSKFDPTAWKERYLVYDKKVSPVRLATSITRTKGAVDVGLYMRYKRFFVSWLLFPNRYREQGEEPQMDHTQQYQRTTFAGKYSGSRKRRRF